MPRHHPPGDALPLPAQAALCWVATATVVLTLGANMWAWGAELRESPLAYLVWASSVPATAWCALVSWHQYGRRVVAIRGAAAGSPGTRPPTSGRRPPAHAGPARRR